MKICEHCKGLVETGLERSMDLQWLNGSILYSDSLTKYQMPKNRGRVFGSCSVSAQKCVWLLLEMT